MSRIFAVTVFCLCSFVLYADVSCLTWNLKWFPSGLRNLRGEKSAELRNITSAGNIIERSIHSLKAVGATNQVVLFVQEVRDGEVCTNLVSASGVEGLQVGVISEFKDETGIPLWQQLAIMTNIKILESGVEEWSVSSDMMSPPRGFAYVVLDMGTDELVACFCVHLKSNLNWSKSYLEEQRNIYKRESSSYKILRKFSDLKSKYAAYNLSAIVAGDFNTNEDNPVFVSEGTLRSFYAAHFRSCFTGLKKRERITCPGNGRYDPATFDYILFRGFDSIVDRKIVDGSSVSDHNPVLITLSNSSK